MKKLINLVHAQKTSSKLIPGPLIVSFFQGESFGIAEGGKFSLVSLNHAKLEPREHNLRPLLTTQTPFQHELPGRPRGGVHFIHCNPPEVLALLRALTPHTHTNNYRIGYWAYELKTAPNEWLEVTKFFHEVWVPSNFVKEALKGAHCPIHVMPHDVLPRIRGESVLPKREKFLIPDGRFAVLAAGDLRSSATRKNLKGSLEIYLTAFPKDEGLAHLILKITNTTGSARVYEELNFLIAGRKDIQILTSSLSKLEILELIKSSDVFLSPHRSEGFGLILAEAIALGTRVLATGWSGNMQFMAMSPETHLPYTLEPVQDADGIYHPSSGQVWAKVDIDESALRLRNLASPPNSTVPDKNALKMLMDISSLWDEKSLKEMTFAQWIKR